MVFQTPVMAQFEQPETGKQATEINWFPETEFKTADLSVLPVMVTKAIIATIKIT